MEKNKKFCIFCGAENDINDLRCLKCKKKLDVKDTPLLDYLKSKIKDKYVGKVQDTVFSIITNYIKSHLYGFILTCSVLVTTGSVVANILNNSTNPSYIEKVQAKPNIVERMNYLGEGLTALEVAEKYVNALSENDFSTVKALQLETFFPNIREQLSDKKYLPEFYGEVSFIKEHNLVDNATTYFKQNKKSIYVGPSELVLDAGDYDGYPFRRFLVTTTYCSYNVCETNENTNYINTFYAHNDIELIEIDGNYYVSGEKVSLFMGFDEQINLHALLREKGDTTNLDFAEEQRKFDQCNGEEACLRDLGF